MTNMLLWMYEFKQANHIAPATGTCATSYWNTVSGSYGSAPKRMLTNQKKFKEEPYESLKLQKTRLLARDSKIETYSVS